MVNRFRRLWLFAALAVAGRAEASGPPLIWFEFGSAKLGAHPNAALDYAAVWLRSANAEQIFIEASADRAGTASLNLALSRRRGDAVKAALVRRGFRPEQIEVRAYGETRPLVETPDGVAERQNRYAMVFIETISPGP